MGLIVDSFAGGGGASLGIAQAIGRAPDIAINHDAAALAMHQANHPDSRHVLEDVWRADLRKLIGRQKVDLLWASPDCRHFSRAKGGKPVSKSVRSLAWVVCKWAQQIRPQIIILENVREFAEWGPLVPRYQCADCDWRGTEGQATLVRVRRKCPRCNCRRLVVTEDMIPDPARKGLTFKRWLGKLRSQGYVMDYRNMDAADFGAPTHRRRLFVIGRRDGLPIVWPEPSHAAPEKIQAGGLFPDHRKPYRTAAECIDWSIPCPSIFERKKPLAEKTLRRIAQGIRRYVLENPKPFIVRYNGEKTENEMRGQSIDESFSTLDTQNRFALATPYIVRANHGGDDFRGQPMDQPMGTHSQKNGYAVIAPILAGTGGPEYAAKPKAIDVPFNTILQEPRIAVIAPTLVQTGYGERDGQSPRALDLQSPLGTVVSGGAKHALVSAFLAKHFGGVVGVPIDTPLPTSTTIATQNQVVAANLVHLNHGDKQWANVEEPMRTVTTGKHAALVYSFLIRYFGTAIGQNLTEPMFTVTGKDRFGLVVCWVHGEPWVIVDIGMRMLTPRELARAQGFPDTYILTGNKSAQVARIGNSVCPPMARAMAASNLGALVVA